MRYVIAQYNVHQLRNLSQVLSALTILLILTHPVYAQGVGNGTWVTTTPLPSRLEYPQALAIDDSIYVLGGDGRLASGGAPFMHDTVYTAQVGTAGALGSWTTTTPFTTGRFLHASAYDPKTRTIYVVGGAAVCCTPISDVQYARILGPGQVGSWYSTTSLPDGGRLGHSALVYRDRLYIFGGG